MRDADANPVWSIILAGGEGNEPGPSLSGGWVVRSQNSIVPLSDTGPCCNIPWIVPIDWGLLAKK